MYVVLLDPHLGRVGHPGSLKILFATEANGPSRFTRVKFKIKIRYGVNSIKKSRRTGESGCQCQRGRREGRCYVKGTLGFVDPEPRTPLLSIKERKSQIQTSHLKKYICFVWTLKIPEADLGVPATRHVRRGMGWEGTRGKPRACVSGTLTRNGP